MAEFYCNGFEITTQQYLHVVNILNDCPVLKDDEECYLLMSKNLKKTFIYLQDNINDFSHDVVFMEDNTSLTWFDKNVDERVTFVSKEQSDSIKEILKNISI
jgi:hypothetical protein